MKRRFLSIKTRLVVVAVMLLFVYCSDVAASSEIQFNTWKERLEPAPVSTLDYGNSDDVARSFLNEYHRLRQELIDEGLLDG